MHAFISVGLDLGEDAQPAWEAVKLGQILSRNAPVSINTTQMSAPDFGGVIDEHRPLPGAEGEEQGSEEAGTGIAISVFTLGLAGASPDPAGDDSHSEKEEGDEMGAGNSSDDEDAGADQLGYVINTEDGQTDLGPMLSGGHDDFIIEALVGRRRDPDNRSVTQYHVKWIGWDACFNRWEPADELPADMVNAFKAGQVVSRLQRQLN